MMLGFQVTRVTGNFTTSEIIATLEYGAEVLGTKVILVMGHGSCGAVDATIQHKRLRRYPHQIQSDCFLKNAQVVTRGASSFRS